MNPYELRTSLTQLDLMYLKGHISGVAWELATNDIKAKLATQDVDASR